MKFVHILVERQTEETFVREVLQPHLRAVGIHLEPKLVTTKRLRGASHYKGGIVSYDKVRFDIRQLLRDTSATLVTTMIDFYGLAGKGFPGWAEMRGSCYERVEQVEIAFRTDIGHPRFHPYLALHEYEALLLCQPTKIVEVRPGASAEAARKLAQIRQEHDSPEEINLDNPPSHRIAEIMPGYRKGLDGVLIALDIGLAAMREQCTHFNQWLTMLESLP